jgi:hypothetical protein
MPMRQSKQPNPPAKRYLPCGRCLAGYVRIIRAGVSLMTPCRCLQDHRAGRTHQPNIIDFKSRAWGEDGDMVA